MRPGRKEPGMDVNTPEVEELERAAAWRLRLVDADASDTASAAAALVLEALAEDLRHNDHAALWTELRSIGNWLGESDAISDYADLAADYGDAQILSLQICAISPSSWHGLSGPPIPAHAAKGGPDKPCHDEMRGLTEDSLIVGRRLSPSDRHP